MIAVIGEFLSADERTFTYTDRETGEQKTGTEKSVKLFDSERDNVVYVSLSRDFDPAWIANIARGDVVAFACYAKAGKGRVYFTALHLANELLGKAVKAA